MKDIATLNGILIFKITVGCQWILMWVNS